MKKEPSTHIDKDLEVYIQSESQHEVSFTAVTLHPKYEQWSHDKNIEVTIPQEISQDMANVYLVYKRPTDDVLNEILYEYGLDTKFPFEVQLCQHYGVRYDRNGNLKKFRVYGERYVGVKREDW